jgi:OmpA-OmpF porin, OOP family
MYSHRRLTGILFSSCLVYSTFTLAAPDGVNLLALGEGALTVESPESSSQAWGPISLLDDAPSSGWCSRKGRIINNVFLIEVPTEVTLTAFEFDTASTDGPRRAAKDIIVEVSSAHDSGFRKVLEASLAEKKDGQRFAAAEAVPSRFVRLTILNSHGDGDWTELMSFRGFGEKPPLQPSPAISGTYRTSDANIGGAARMYDFHLRQQGGAFSGCYEFQQGVFDGTIEGRVVKLTWTQPGNQRRGPAVFVFTPDGRSFRGYWWYDTDKARAVDGDWTGSRVSNAVGSCPHWSGSVSGRLRSELSAAGRTRLYGVVFDVDSARLRNESLQTLDEVVRLLSTEPAWKITIEGHTDSTGTAAHNQVLSENRAAAVKAYLISKGIPRLALLQPGSDNPDPLLTTPPNLVVHKIAALNWFVNNQPKRAPPHIRARSDGSRNAWITRY